MYLDVAYKLYAGDDSHFKNKLCVGANGSTPYYNGQLTILSPYGYAGMLNYNSTGTVGLQTLITNDAGWFGTRTDNPLYFFTNDGYSGSTPTNPPAMMITSNSKNVGIGTISPAYRLTVSTGTGYGMVHTNSSGTIAVGSKIDASAGWLGTKTYTPLYLYTNDASAPQLMIDNTTNNIGINTTSPAYRLTVTTGIGSNYGMVQTNGTIEVGSKVDGTAGWLGTPSNHPLYLFANASSTPQLTIDNATNNIGIGTVTPTKKLDIKGSFNKNVTTTENLFQITTADPSNNLNLQIGLIGNSNSNNRYGLIEVKEGTVYKSLVLQPTNGNVAIGLGSNAPTEKLQVRGNVIVGEISSENLVRNFLRIESYISPEIRFKSTTDNEVMRIGLSTGDNMIQYGMAEGDLYAYSASVDRMDLIVKKSGGIAMGVKGGNVGIGTYAPENSEGWSKVLDVRGSSNSAIIATTTASSDISSIRTGLWSNAVTSFGSFGALAGGLAGTSSQHPFSLVTNNLCRLTIATQGNIGIGTITPSQKLEINGAIKLGNTVTPTNGTFRFNGTDFEGYAGGTWQSFTSTTASWVLNSNNLINSNSGGVVIGTTCLPAGYKLAVKGKIICEELMVKLESGNCWADYVFNNDYKLMPLSEVEQFIKLNKHLPNIPNTEEIQNKGLDVNDIIVKQMAKIEELTLYMIELQKEIEKLKKQ